MQVYDKMPKVLTNLRRASNKEQKKAMLEAKQHLAAIPRPHIPSRLVTLWKEFQSALQALSVIAFGGLLIGRLEGWPWFTSIYYSVITGTSVYRPSS